MRLPKIRLKAGRLYQVNMRVRLNPFTFSQFMFSECCNAPVFSVEDFSMDGYHIVCARCRTTLDFAANEDRGRLADGKLPYGCDPVRFMLDLSGFAEAVMNAAKAFHMFYSVWQAAEEDPIIGHGTEMVDGQWKPKGFLSGTQEDPQSTED